MRQFAVTVFAAVLCGCASGNANRAEPKREGPPAVEPAPPAAASGGNATDPGAGPAGPVLGLPDVVVEMEGRKIGRDEFLQKAVEWYGREVVEEMILRFVFKRATEDSGASITPKELDDRAAAEVKMREQEAPQKFGVSLKDYLKKFGQTVEQFKEQIKANEDFQRQILLEYMLAYAQLTEPRVDVSEISVGSLEKAEAVRSKARDGADFSELAKRESQDYLGASGGKMPEFVHGMNPLGQAFEDAAFALQEPGSLSPPVKVGDIYYVIRLNRRYPADPRTFESLRARILAAKMDKNSLNSFMRLLRSRYVKGLKYNVPDLEPKKN